MFNGRHSLVSLFPAAKWLRHYPRHILVDDLTAGLITAVLLIPQGMAYALLAGLPAEVGLYASVLPPVVYALMGTSQTLSVGAVAVVALLVADALSDSGVTPGEAAYIADAMLLAVLSGGVLLLMGLVRLGALVNLVGRSVLSGFTSGAAVLIILSQLPNLTGMTRSEAGTGLDVLRDTFFALQTIHPLTASLGLISLGLLIAFRLPLVRMLERSGVNSKMANLVGRAGTLGVIALLTGLVAVLGLQKEGVAIVGQIPSGLPAPSWHFFRPHRFLDLLPSAVMISLIGYVGSVSVAKVLAHRRREKIRNNQELIALGAANVAASFTGSMPVAGGLSRSMINNSAGAKTQLAAIVTALLVALVALFFTALFYFLPKAALAAAIIVAVIPLLDWKAAIKAWRYDYADGLALMVTFAGVVMVDIEAGLLAGVVVGVGAFLWRSSRPHIAIVGRVPGTEHFRNVNRHEVQTWEELLLLRVDRSLFFANVGYVEEVVADAAAAQPKLKHLVIICSAVNVVDYSAVETLEQLAANFREAGITLHLAEVKGPVFDRLSHNGVPDRFAPGQMFLSTEEAVKSLLGRTV